MTRTEAYDLACTKWKAPAAVQMGDRCVLGEWLPLAEILVPEGTILASASKAVQVYGSGATWEEAAVRAGLLPVGGEATLMLAEANATPPRPSVITNTRMATVTDVLAHKDTPVTTVSSKSVCRTYGCGEPRADGPFCPKCFEEHRDERELANPPPATRGS